MKKILILLFVAAMSGNVHAQVDLGKAAGAMAGGANVGGLISQLGKGILPSSFADGWAKVKDSWFKNASSITDVAGAKKALSTLVNNLKPSALMKSFSKSGWLSKLNGASSLTDIGGSMKSLVGGLNPSSLTKDFAGQTSAYTSALDGLK